jgi:hypothetical protein
MLASSLGMKPSLLFRFIDLLGVEYRMCDIEAKRLVPDPMRPLVVAAGRFDQAGGDLITCAYITGYTALPLGSHVGALFATTCSADLIQIYG